MNYWRSLLSDGLFLCLVHNLLRVGVADQLIHALGRGQLKRGPDYRYSPGQPPRLCW